MVLAQQVLPNKVGLPIDFQLNTLVIQPISLCNLNCTYCYLPDRDKKQLMQGSTAKKIAWELSELNLDHPVNVLWHSGEPLTIGFAKFDELLAPFEELRTQNRIRHSIQTNGTLITKEWCNLFLKYDFSVGVSIDGWRPMSKFRVDWRGGSAYDKIIAGIRILKESKVSFGVICVVTDESINYPSELYNFFCSLGCESAGFSIVEEEGVNKNLLLQRNERVKEFWSRLLISWMENPLLNIREFRRAAVWLESEVNDKQATSVMKDTLPSIGYNGDVVLVSPEFLGIKPSLKYETFIVGNVLNSSLSDIIKSGLESKYIKDYIEGIVECRNSCKYFDYCRGGDASNKYFELGTLNDTETNHCRNTKIHLIDAILEQL